MKLADIIPPTKVFSYTPAPAVLCECGAWTPSYNGEMGNHSRPYGAPRVAGGNYPGTYLCRHSGRTITLEAAIRRDERSTDAERRVAYAVYSQLAEGLPVRFPWEGQAA